MSLFAAMWRVRLAAYRVCGAGAVQGRGRCARVVACAGDRDRSRRAGRGSAGRVWVSVEDTAQGRRQRRAWVLRGRQQHDRRDRFVHGCRGGYADAGASGAIARQARRGDRGGARRRARGAGRASEEAADGRGSQARAQRARSGRRDCGNRAARGHQPLDGRRRDDFDRARGRAVNRGGRRSVQPGESRAEPQAGRERDGDGGDSRIVSGARSVLRCGQLQHAGGAARCASDGRRRRRGRDSGGGAQCGAAEISRARSSSR